MTDLLAKNLLIYLGTFILPPVTDAVYQAITAQMVGGKPIDWGQVAVVALLAALASYIASTRPKVGHETQAALIDSVGHAAATTVLAETVAAQIGGVAVTPFTPAQVQQIAAALHGPVSDELEERLKATPVAELPPVPMLPNDRGAWT